jgi:hypothetical protein
MVAALGAAPAAENWPQWRGPSLNGISAEKNLPVRWSRTDNITWKLALPAWSASTPIVWGDRIFLNVAEGRDLYLWCVDRTRGVMLWKQLLGGGNMQRQKHNMSSPSPATDGKNVWVMTGTGILKAFDFEGKEIWARDLQKEFGRFGMQYGYGASPVVFEDSTFRSQGFFSSDRLAPRISKANADDLAAERHPGGARVARRTRRRRPRHGANIGSSSPAAIVTGHDPSTGKELGGPTASTPTTTALTASSSLPSSSGTLSLRRRENCRFSRSRQAAAATCHGRTCCGPSTTGPTCPRRRPMARISMSSTTAGSCGAST